MKKQTLKPLQEKLKSKEWILESHQEGSYPTPFGYSADEYNTLLEEEITWLKKIIEAIEKVSL